MTQERMIGIAEQLEAKAVSVADGFYGEADDDESWAADLKRAAKRLRRGAEGVQDLSTTDLEEIECGTDIDGAELAGLRKEAREANE
jgi:sugar phosphate isomerase/epimerase